MKDMPEAGQSQHIAEILKPYHTVALVLQGGGALGAYQAGVFEALHEAGISASWLSGVSPRLADSAAPAAFCWAADLAGMA